MPSIARLISENIDIVFENLHAFVGIFDNDAAFGVTDEPVEQGNRVFVVDRFSNDSDVLKSLLDFIDRGEVHRNPERELVSGDIGFAVDSVRLILSIAGEVEPSDSEAGFVGAVKIKRGVFFDDAHADEGVLRFHITEKSGVIVVISRGDDDFLTIAGRPVEITTEEHITFVVVETNACTHDYLLKLLCL